MYKKAIVIIVICCLISSVAIAYDDKQTHPKLTDNAVKNAYYFRKALRDQLGIEDIKTKLSNGKELLTITQWLKKGSEKEDEPTCRASNHFHNPLKSWSRSHLSDPIWVVDRWCELTSPFTQKYSNISWATGFVDNDRQLLPDTVNGIETPNEHEGRNWIVAVDKYFQALTGETPQEREKHFAETFKTLGYVLHLLQDTAVPAHTRNDFSQGHSQIIGCPDTGRCLPISWVGNPYEGYVRDNFDAIDNDILTISQFYTGVMSLTNFWDTDTIGDNVIPQNGFDIGLAEYSNGNFVSHSTIFRDNDDINHYFRYPNRGSIADQEYPHKIGHYLARKIVAKDKKIDDGVVFIEKYTDGERIKKFLTPRYIPFEGVDGSDWYSEEKFDLIFTLNDECYKEYATFLIPRAIGYSAALLDYFFRPLTLEVSPPDQYVYAIIDGSVIDQNTQYIHTLKAKVRNSTPDEKILKGLLVAVAKYKKYSIYSPYQPNLSSGSPSAGMRETEFSYSTSAEIEISSLSSTTPEEFTFDFTNSPIPAGITDLSLQVVFKGTLGNENEQAVAVGMKDLNEPQHITIWNYTDYFQLNGIPVTAEYIRINHPTIETVAYIDPFPFTESIGFSRHYPAVDFPPVVEIADLPPARYSRIIVVTDSDDTSYYLSDHVVVSVPPNKYGIDPNIDETWKYTLPIAEHQEDSDGVWQSTSVYRVRGIVQHQNVYYINCSPGCSYINNLEPPDINDDAFPATIYPSN